MTDSKKKSLRPMRSVEDSFKRTESDQSFLSVIQNDKIDINLAEKANFSSNSAMLAVRRAT